MPSAIEMVHTASLILDDLPSMDNDDLRRGQPTCHIRFDEATAILAGDALQTLAFQTIAEDEQLSPQTRVRLVSEDLCVDEQGRRVQAFSFAAAKQAGAAA